MSINIIISTARQKRVYATLWLHHLAADAFPDLLLKVLETTIFYDFSMSVLKREIFGKRLDRRQFVTLEILIYTAHLYIFIDYLGLINDDK